MGYLFVIVILTIGLSGLSAQVLLLRELLLSFYGNELVLGVVLANWLAWEALGVMIVGKFIDKIKQRINTLIILEIVFSLMLPVSIYLSRDSRNLLGIPFGEGIGVTAIFFISLFVTLPLGFCHGALFSVAAKVFFSEDKEGHLAIGKVYSLETLGTIIGGLVMTYCFLPRLNSFQIAFVVLFLNLGVCLLFLRRIWYPLRYLLVLTGIAVVYLSSAGKIGLLQRNSVNRQWKNLEVLDYRNSLYGNIVVTRQGEQYTFFYNGTPIITAPFPDKQFVEEFGHLPLLFHPHPKNILVISAGAGGLINEILKHPIKSLDYAELDPLIIGMIKKYPTPLTETELNDPRVDVRNIDGRFFLRRTTNHYDVILIGVSNPADLFTNRLFTQEFFLLAKERLNSDGILAFWLPGSLSYLGPELKDLNVSILNALKDAYAYIRIIPGDYNIYLASLSKKIREVNPALLSQRIIKQDIKTSLLVPSYLGYRLNGEWSDWFSQNIVSGTKRVNRDLRPFAVFAMLRFSEKKFSSQLGRILGLLQKLDLRSILVFIIVVTGLLLSLAHNKKKRRLSIFYSVATTGFFGMLSSLILIFAYQIYFGYLYQRIGILVSIFMAGTALGGILMTSWRAGTKNALRQFMELESLIVACSLFLAFIAGRSFWSGFGPWLIFLMNFVCGFLMGLEFPIASKICLDKGKGVGETAGFLYGADLIGGWFAGVLGGVVLLPILGVFNACLMMALFKLSSLILFSTTKRLT